MEEIGGARSPRSWKKLKEHKITKHCNNKT